MKIHLRNHQTAHRLHLPAIRRLSRDLAGELEADDPQTDWREVTLLLTDHEGITQLNRLYFAENRPTDVISFRIPPIPGEHGSSGDLAVNVERAVEEGPRHRGADFELALYIAHGFNHLSGADDNTPARRAAMRRIERRRLAQFKPRTLIHPSS